MLTALTIDSKKIEPSYNIIAFCGNCGSRVYAKCVTPGKTYLKIKHFYHPRGAICDDWFEPVSEWHKDWQSYVPIEQREVSIDNGHARHIADILLPTSPNIVVELQKSPIPYDIKEKRDAFYKNIFWLIHNNLKDSKFFQISNKPIFIDLLDGDIQTPFGNKIKKEQFIEQILLNPNLKYEDWIFGFDGKVISTRHGKKTLDEIEHGEHITFSTNDNIISQCLSCNNRKVQRQPKNQLIAINSIPHFQCGYCGKLYETTLIPFNPKGDDDQYDLRKDYREFTKQYGNTSRRFWEELKQKKRSGCARVW